MKRFFFPLFGVLLLLFAACSSQQTSKQNSNQTNNMKKYNYTFMGEGDNWFATYKEKITYENGEYNSEDEMTLTYKGHDKQSVDKVECSFILPNGSLSGSDYTLNSSGTIVIQAGSRSTVFPSLPQKDNMIKATVKWNGKKEIFDMKYS